MTDLVERYVVKVGSYLPESEREEVQNELRSLIQDQLDDRYKGAPTQDDVVELLKEFGDPREMAASYGREQYLIGPDLYPTMMYVLQRGWMWVPIIVVLVRVIVAFVGGDPGSIFGLFLSTFFTVLQALFVFSGIVVIIFALMQYGDVDLDEHRSAFDPLELPRVNDPAAIDKGDVVGTHRLQHLCGVHLLLLPARGRPDGVVQHRLDIRNGHYTSADGLADRLPGHAGADDRPVRLRPAARPLDSAA